MEGVVDSAVFQRTVDYPDEFAPGYHMVLHDGAVVTVRRERVIPALFDERRFLVL